MPQVQAGFFLLQPIPMQAPALLQVLQMTETIKSKISNLVYGTAANAALMNHQKAYEDIPEADLQVQTLDAS